MFPAFSKFLVVAKKFTQLLLSTDQKSVGMIIKITTFPNIFPILHRLPWEKWVAGVSRFLRNFNGLLILSKCARIPPALLGG